MIDYGHLRLADFALDSGKTHLNHGSYGAVPLALTAAQAGWRERIERNPTGFMRAELPDLLREAARRVAAAFGGRGDDWVFVDNATAGANAVIASLVLEPGDHLLATGEVYNAVRQALRHHAGRRGVEIEEIALPIPVPDPAAVVAVLEARIGPRTKAVFIDHVTSRSGLILPVAEIAARCRRADVALFVDGAHAPGMLDLDIPALGVDWYVGNGHKWLCAPRGCGFLWTAPARQDHLHPVIISHGYGLGYRAEFDWTGTRDPSAWLSVTAALDWHEAMGGPALRQRGQALALAMGARLSGALGEPLSGPAAMMGSMATLRLPDGFDGDPKQIAMALDARHDVVVSVNEIQGRNWLRVSAAIYNEASDSEALLTALEAYRG